MTYCTDNDLTKYRGNILSLGVSSWETQREEAYSMINRVITARWYRSVALEMGYDPNITAFDPSYVATGTLTRLEAFKTLELAYLILAKDCPKDKEDGFEVNRKKFRDLYNEELELVLAVGIDYDFSGSGVFDDDEKYLRAPRRIKRA